LINFWHFSFSDLQDFIDVVELGVFYCFQGLRWENNLKVRWTHDVWDLASMNNVGWTGLVVSLNREEIQNYVRR
jgi:hypothetical protein